MKRENKTTFLKVRITPTQHQQLKELGINISTEVRKFLAELINLYKLHRYENGI